MVKKRFKLRNVYFVQTFIENFKTNEKLNFVECDVEKDMRHLDFPLFINAFSLLVFCAFGHKLHFFLE